MSEIIPTGWSIVGVGDFNGDGVSDLLLRYADGTVTDWLGQPGGDFSTRPVYYDAPNGWHIVGIGDFNGGGRDDVLWRNDDGTVSNWLGQPDAGLSSNPVYYNAPNSWHIVGTGDFNGDGRSDVLWRNDDGTLTDWQGQSDGGLAGDVVYYNVPTNWHVAGIGDFNGDGIDDILWRNDDGTLSDWSGQSGGGFAIAPVYYNVAASQQIAGIADFNGDHRSDILWRGTDGTISNWLGQPNGGFVDNSSIASQWVSGDLQVAAVGDFNGDGKSDVLWRNPDGTLETWVGSANGGILSPMEKLWQDAVTGAGQLVTAVVKALPPPTPTDSGGDGRGISLTGFAAIFGPSFPTNYVEGLYDEVHAATLNTFDPSEGSGFDFTWSASSNVGGGAQQFGSITQFDSGNAYLFDVNGADLIGNWFAGAPPVSEPIPPDAIVITASSAIVITASHETTTGFFLFDPNANGFNFNDGYGGRSGGGGITGTHYLTPNVSAAANAFATRHVHNHGTTPADQHAYELAHDALAKFFEWANDHPILLVDVGHGYYVSAATALAYLSGTQIVIQDNTPPANRGAWTQATPGYGSATIHLDPQNTDPHGIAGWVTDYGDAGLDFVIFHELGHALNDLSLNPPGTEATANSAAFSMMDALGLIAPPRSAVMGPNGGGLDD